jgi:hypothetical protein
MKGQTMKRTMMFTILVATLACPGEKKAVKDTTPLDTMPADLSGLKSNIPEAAPDTFRPKPPKPVVVGGRTIPSAPQVLMDAVSRSQSVTKFCYQEKGQKADPSLRGNVAMIVTVGGTGVTAARVGDSNWSSSSGRAVNQCLNERTPSAWKLVPGSVPPGTYSVQLSFTG